MLWTRHKNAHGYGQLRFQGKIEAAHRASWILTHGSIDDETLVLHNCPSGDNPSCVNPEHLWIGSHQDNCRDKYSKGRGNNPYGERHHKARLTDKQVIEIRQLARQYSHQEIANLFHMSRGAISSIIHRKTWKHI